MISKDPEARGRTRSGWTTPDASIEAARAARASSSKRVRGWSGFGSIASTGSSRSSPESSAISGRIAASPRPMPRFSATADQLLRKALVGGRAAGGGSMLDHWLAVAWGLGDPHAAGDDGLEDLPREVLAKLAL